MTKRRMRCSPFIEDCESGEHVLTAWKEQGCKDMFRHHADVQKTPSRAYLSLNGYNFYNGYNFLV